MASFRARFEEVKGADAARTKLIEDLIGKVDDLEKTMDRNAFVLVLIDGDGMNFLDELIKQGIAGGEQASQMLRREVFNELRMKNPDFNYDHKIVIKVYANMRGLSKLYTQYGLDVSEFILGFNKSNPLCDFIDAGNHKESADKKIQETLNLYVYNVHCKHIIFGASTDNSYASFLGSFHDIDISKRIRLLEGPPFAAEFKTILPRFQQTKFPTIFRSTKIDITQRHFAPVKKAAAEEFADLALRGGRVRPPATPGAKIIEQSMVDRRSIDRPISPTKDSPTKNLLDRGGGVSLRPRPMLQHSTEDSTPAKQRKPRAEVPIVELALMRATLEILNETPRSCDFANVKRRAERLAGLDASFWGTLEEEYWFNRSKTIIKWTVEQWLLRTNSQLPGNATWLFKHFPAGKSTSAVLQQPAAKEWRIQGEPGWQKMFEAAAMDLDIVDIRA